MPFDQREGFIRRRGQDRRDVKLLSDEQIEALRSLGYVQ
jgi:hypothetical protein